MKFKEITPKKGNLNLLTGKRIKKKKTNIKSLKSNEYIIPISLNIHINKNYKGITNGIAGAMLLLPKAIRLFLDNAEIKRIIASAGNFMFVLDNNFTFKIIDTVLGGRKGTRIIIKEKKNIILDKFI